MTTYINYQDILFNYNLTGNANGTRVVPGIVLNEQDDKYVVTYSILNSGLDVAALVYYPVDSPEEQYFADTDYRTLINTRLSEILSASDPNDARMLFTDVANIAFANTDVNGNGTFDAGEGIGIITYGQIKETYTGHPGSFNSSVSGFTTPYDTNLSTNLHGDVWFNTNHSIWAAQNEDISWGDASYKVLLEETLHVLGADNAVS
ncbi:MAG: hypothetical protein LRY57_04540 [Alphaproteobacteria bacterium]|nr:hypothetical protein [Alphaproteobacteria bacterium]